MKKFMIAMLATLCAAVLSVAVFAGCGGNKEGGNPSGGNPTGGTEDKGTLYSIQAPSESDNYTVSGLPENAYEGDTVSFTVTLTHPADSILNQVEVRGTEMGYKTLTAGADNKYSFEMPAEPVFLSVDVSYYPDNETDNFLSWSSDNQAEFEIFVETADDTYFAQMDDGLLTADVTKSPSQSGGYFTSHTEEAFSLNQDVIPDEALSVKVTYKSMSNNAIAFVVHIDRTKIKAGTAKIVLVVNNGHKFSDKAVLACTVTVKAAD